MDDFEKPFEWIDFPEGRVSYTGGAKGRDEPPIRTFAVDLGGTIYYGEISELFLSNRSDFNLEVISFGWPSKEWFGSAPTPVQCAAFSTDDLETVQTLICRAVQVWLTLPRRPLILRESADSHFQGDVQFREGWALTLA